MKLILTKSPSGWDGFQNPDSGLIFESYLRDVPKGHIGLKCYLHNKPICQAVALSLGKVGLTSRTVHGYVVSLEAMKQTFMPLHGVTDKHAMKEQFRAMYPQIIEGWEMILGNDPPPKDGIRVELFFAGLSS